MTVEVVGVPQPIDDLEETFQIEHRVEGGHRRLDRGLGEPHLDELAFEQGLLVLRIVDALRLRDVGAGL